MNSKPIFDRRQGPDWRIKTLRVTSVSAWLFLLFSLITFKYARPESVPGYAKYKGLEHLFRLEWDVFLSSILFYELVLCCILSLLTIAVHQTRNKRASDNKGYNQLLVLIVSLTCAVFIGFEVL